MGLQEVIKGIQILQQCPVSIFILVVSGDLSFPSVSADEYYWGLTLAWTSQGRDSSCLNVPALCKPTRQLLWSWHG